MIITLRGADFSKSNIGILTKWRISTNLGAGATYDGPAAVEKGSMFGTTIKIDSGYVADFSNIIVTMDGVVLNGAYTIQDNEVVINIAAVTGDVNIQIATLPLYTLTIAPVPATATVTINGEERKTITVPAGTEVDWYVSAVDYKPQNGTHVVTSNQTLDIALVEADIINLYDAAQYPVERCYYGNSPNILASNTKVVNPQRSSTTASLGLDVQKFPVEGGKTYSIKLYNAPTEATTMGTDEDTDGTYENATTIPYFGFYGLMFWETIDGIPSLRYVHTTSNNGNQFAYWNTTKQSTYTGDIPISDTNEAAQFGITSNTSNAEAVVVTNLATGTKSSELNKCIFGTEENKFTQAAQVDIHDENITHMSIMFGCPKDTLYQMGTVGGVKVGVLSDEDRAAAIETMQNGLMIVEGTRLPASYIAYQD